MAASPHTGVLLDDDAAAAAAVVAAVAPATPPAVLSDADARPFIVPSPLADTQFEFDPTQPPPPELLALPAVPIPPGKTPAIRARGRSISLARRAAATAKKRRDAARLQLSRTGMGHAAVQGVIERTAATRSNVSQTRHRGKRAGRRRVKWTQREVAALKRGVETYGVGRWAVILREYADDFEPTRISVDLKDKWRNIFKTPKDGPSNAESQLSTSPPTLFLPPTSNSFLAAPLHSPAVSQQQGAALPAAQPLLTFPDLGG